MNWFGNEHTQAATQGATHYVLEKDDTGVFLYINQEPTIDVFDDFETGKEWCATHAGAELSALI